MLKEKRGLLFAVLLSLSILMGSCSIDMFGFSSDDDDNDSAGLNAIEQEIENAKALLSQGQYREARLIFQTILDEMDPENSVAHFGWALSEGLYFSSLLVDQMIELGDTLEIMAGFRQTGVAGAMVYDRDKGFVPLQGYGVIAGVLANFFDPLEASLIQIDEHFETALLDPNMVFIIDELPFYTYGRLVMEMGGEYDHVEILIGSALTKLLRTIIDIILGTNFEIDLEEMVRALGVLLDGEEDMDPANIIAMVAYLFDRSYSFLELSTDGESRYIEAGQRFGYAADYIARAIEEGFAETDDQGDDIFAVDFGASPPQAVFQVTLSSDIIGTATSHGIGLIDITAEYKMAMERVRDNMLSGGDPINWVEDMTPIVSVLLIIMLDSGLAQIILEELVKTLSDDIAQIINDAAQNSRVNSEDLSYALTTMIPGWLKLDIGHFFANPQGIRAIFPPVFVPADADTDDSKIFDSDFYAEWECVPDDFFGDESIVPGLFCPGESTGKLTDAGHFPGLADLQTTAPGTATDICEEYDIPSIPPDGIFSGLPYLPVSDPSFNGLLYLDVNAMNEHQPAAADDDYSGYQLADLYAFNKALSAFSEGIIDLVGGSDFEDIIHGD